MNVHVRTQLRSAKGPVTLGREIARGGEGAVYEVEGIPGEVAKVYLKPIDEQKSRKLAAMRTMATARILETTAWPIETLSTMQGVTVGFLMPKAAGFKEVHNLYGPKSRKAEFPSADWRFLVHAAANTARALAAVHEAGAAVGDFNQGGVMVSDKALTKLIDCDSFQVVVGKTTYPCNVGTPQFTPPELQGRSFRGLTRTADHDNFGFAVLAFQLLFLGRHPFSGRYALGDMPLEQAIKEHRFAYGAGRAALQMEPPPGVPSLDTCTPAIARLFERAFAPISSGALRPSATEWVGALEALEKQARQCEANPSHHYPSGLGSCPWCKFEGATGVPMFGVQIRRVEIGGARFDVNLAWGSIAAVQSPGGTPKRLSQSEIGRLKPSPEASSSKSTGTAVVIVAVFVAICLIAAIPQGTFFWLLLAGGIAMAAKGLKDPQVIATMRERHSVARTEHSALQARWDREASEATFSTRLAELRSDRDRLVDLPNLRTRRLKELEDGRKAAQLKRYLEAFRVERATITGVGAGRKTTLTSFGIETAWDVTRSSILSVPGFGPALTGKMLEWRREIERRFRFDPARGVDPKDIAAMDRDLAATRRNLETSLANGAGDLARLRTEILTVRTSIGPLLDAATRNLAQTETDLRAAGG